MFPLPSAVLFPGAVLPLHIFEPRYRELVHDTLAGDGVMALAQLEPGWESEYEGRPELSQICCAGVLGWHERLKDGRFNIIVQGVVRGRVLRELAPRKAYREIRVQLLPDPPQPTSRDPLLRQAILEVSGRVSGDAGEALLLAASRTTGGPLADVVASALVTDVERRQEILAQLDVDARAQMVLDELSELIARMGPGESSGSPN